ncbi:MAG: LuxR C-terminal-related transcriptional regulator [Deltaproteobacteria bacterium]|nr:LuxR C-terminal-related transcriptional regulator [Deltaproteobacteria bacterium]
MTPDENSSKVLFIGTGRGCESHVRALVAAGNTCERVPTVEQAMVRLRDASDDLDLVVWDAESQMWALDDAFDKGRYRARVPTLLLLDQVYPWIASHGRRPGSLDYLLKPVAPTELVAAAAENVRLVRARRYVDETRQQLLVMAANLARARELLGPMGFGADDQVEREATLSDREEQIARLLAKGHRVSHIADLLGISPHTVRNHFKSVFRKLGVHSQVELLAKLRVIYANV